MNELNQAYLHKLFTTGDKVYVFRFLRLVLHWCLFRRDLDSSLSRRGEIWRTKYTKKWSISTLRETYINWNWLDQAWGRFNRDDRWFSLKLLLKLASKCWFDDLNEICCCASFVCWPKMVLVLHLLRSFLKYFVNIPGCVWRFESWCVDYVDIPGCVWNFMSGFPKWIVKDLLTAMYESCAICSIFQRKSIH